MALGFSLAQQSVHLHQTSKLEVQEIEHWQTLFLEKALWYCHKSIERRRDAKKGASIINFSGRQHSNFSSFCLQATNLRDAGEFDTVQWQTLSCCKQMQGFLRPPTFIRLSLSSTGKHWLDVVRDSSFNRIFSKVRLVSKDIFCSPSTDSHAFLSSKVHNELPASHRHQKLGFNEAAHI